MPDVEVTPTQESVKTDRDFPDKSPFLTGSLATASRQFEASKSNGMVFALSPNLTRMTVPLAASLRN